MRRYREKGHVQLSVAIKSGERVHDFLKGWGTICKDGSVLWDWWRPPTKKQQKRFAKYCKFEKWIFPIIKKVYPKLITKNLVSIQPMT
jgi:hypothetical protein